jgi:hypothetical protein
MNLQIKNLCGIRLIFLGFLACALAPNASVANELKITVNTSAIKFIPMVDCSGSILKNGVVDILSFDSSGFVADVRDQAIKFAEGAAIEECKKMDGKMSFAFIQDITTDKSARCKAIYGDDENPSGGFRCDATVSINCNLKTAVIEQSQYTRYVEGPQTVFPTQRMCDDNQ